MWLRRTSLGAGKLKRPELKLNAPNRSATPQPQPWPQPQPQPQPLLSHRNRRYSIRILLHLVPDKNEHDRHSHIGHLTNALIAPVRVRLLEAENRSTIRTGANRFWMIDPTRRRCRDWGRNTEVPR